MYRRGRDFSEELLIGGISPIIEVLETSKLHFAIILGMVKSGETREDEEKEETSLDTRETSNREVDANHLFVFANKKAGMEKVDQKKTNQIIYNLSKDSLFFQNTLHKDEKATLRIESMLEKVKSLSPAQLQQHERQADRVLESLELARDLTRIHVVCDMDMFYAAVEMRDNPALRSVPLAVGGNSMISTTNYIARQYGVRAAMPGFIGKKLCPDLVFVAPHMNKYKAVAQEIRAIFAFYDPNFTTMSLDEAKLDITAYCHQNQHKYPITEESSTVAQLVVEEMRQKIFRQTQLTASAGIACNPTLAKICSDLNKPNGQYYLCPSRQAIMEFVDKLSVRKFGGIGKVMEKTLHALQIQVGRDLYVHRGVLHAVFSPGTARWLFRLALGIQSEQKPIEPRKSLSIERTFPVLEAKALILAECDKLAQKLTVQLQKEGLRAKTLTLKLKAADFSVITRAHTSTRYFADVHTITTIARNLLEPEFPLHLRLLGLRLSSFHQPRPRESSQLRLADCTTKPAKMKAKGECPICGQDLVIDQISNVNRHLDECLQIGPSTRKRQRQKKITSYFSRKDYG